MRTTKKDFKWTLVLLVIGRGDAVKQALAAPPLRCSCPAGMHKKDRQAVRLPVFVAEGKEQCAPCLPVFYQAASTAFSAGARRIR